jgi:hypothetical protein
MRLTIPAGAGSTEQTLKDNGTIVHDSVDADDLLEHLHNTHIHTRNILYKYI